jgi:hypothetical protein
VRCAGACFMGEVAGQQPSPMHGSATAAGVRARIVRAAAVPAARARISEKARMIFMIINSGIGAIVAQPRSKRCDDHHERALFQADTAV